jgi:hypothetical protein
VTTKKKRAADEGEAKPHPDREPTEKELLAAAHDEDPRLHDYSHELGDWNRREGAPGMYRVVKCACGRTTTEGALDKVKSSLGGPPAEESSPVA